jgi:hypothetical protein
MAVVREQFEMKKRKSGLWSAILVLTSCLAITGCRSRHIDSTINNRTGGAIHQVQVDYPSASFGVDTLAQGQIYLYRFKVQGEGAIKVQYTDAAGHQILRQGPHVKEGDEGQYLIILQPDGEVQWQPALTSKK